jgi:hypothetical protein
MGVSFLDRKRTWGLLLCLTLPSCGSPTSSTASPSPQPQINGNYTLSVQASTSCTNLNLKTYQWNVVATYSTNALGFAQATAPLPGPAPVLTLTLTYATNVLTPSSVAGSLSTPVANLPNGPGNPIPGSSLKFNTTASLAGTVASAPNARGEVMNGGMAGDIQLIDANNNLVSNCIAANHQWSLIVR